jgi:predicted peroxiredoxin
MTRLVIKIASGVEALERCNQGWSVATMAIASGVDVSVWLTGDAVRFAVPGYAEGVTLEGAHSFAVAVRTVLDEATLTACSQCLGRRELTAADLLEGVRIAGAAGFVEEIIAPDAKPLVY